LSHVNSSGCILDDNCAMKIATWKSTAKTTSWSWFAV